MEKGDLIGRGRTAEVLAWGTGRVLKLFLGDYPTEGAEYEAEAMRAVRAAGIPVPAVYETIRREGRPGIVMEHIDGPTMLDLLRRQPWAVRRHARTLAQLHVQMHGCRASGLQPLRLQMWGSIARGDGLAMGTKQALMKALVGLPHGEAVCHYDFHPMNVIMSRHGPVIIDWQGAGIGIPLLDVTRAWLLLKHATISVPFPGNIAIRTLRAAFYTEYISCYRQLSPFDTGQVRVCQTLIAAARFVEVPEEKGHLLRLLKSILPHVNIPFEAQNVP